MRRNQTQARQSLSFLLARVRVAAVLLLWASVGCASPADSDPTISTEPVPAGRLRILQLETITRFNYMDRENGVVTDRGLQYRLRTGARLNLTETGNTYITVRAETGKGFDNSWNNTGIGLGPSQWVFNVKSLALHHQIGSRAEIQMGGIEFDPGAGTDSTYASGDGPMTGYRLLLHKSADWQPDKLSFTAGYVGDFDKPNIFSRFRMDRMNYGQVLAQQHLTDTVDGSAEFDSIRGVPFSRLAVRRRRFWVFDNATLEGVTRLSQGVSVGWAATLEHDWNPRWGSSLLYTQMPDRLYIIGGERVFFNRGEIATGKRLSAGTTFHATRHVDIGAFGGRLLDSTPSKRWVAQLSIGVQYAHLANRLLQ